jgi:preprotein translocase subunit Sec63
MLCKYKFKFDKGNIKKNEKKKKEKIQKDIHKAFEFLSDVLLYQRFFLNN